MTTAVLERPLVETPEYAPAFCFTDTFDRQECTDDSCAKTAKWEVRVHRVSDVFCRHEFYCQEHVDETIGIVLALFNDGAVKCSGCGESFLSPKGYFAVVRIP